jgi:uncharacterized protein
VEQLKIGTYDGTKLFTLPAATTVTNTEAIIARKRSGKSYTADVMAEEMQKHKQQVGIIDPTGAHYGLRASADGKKAGYPIVVFGGDHPDAPLDWRGGREMALAFIKHGFSAIWDISNFDTEEQIVFVNDFCREMLKSNREAVHIFIDEADTYAPQMLESKAQKICLGSVRRLVKQGGVRGVGVTLITQRSSDLSKSVLSQVDSMVALTVSHPPDIAPIVDWVSANVGAEDAASIKAEMPKLVIGEAFFCSRGSMTRVKVRLRETFNSGATPKPGERKVEPKVLAAIDVQQLGQKIAESVAEAQANTPEALKKKIAALEAAAKIQTTAVSAIGQKEYEMVKEKLDALSAEIEAIDGRVAKMKSKMSKAREIALQLAETLDDEDIENIVGDFVRPIEVEARRMLPPAKAIQPSGVRIASVPAAQPPVDGEVKLRGKSLAMLQICAGMYPKGLTEAQVAMQSGMKRSSGTFGDYKSLLKTSGCIQFDGGLWFATKEGMRRAGTNIPKHPTTTDEVLSLWMPKLRGKSKDMLTALIAHKGQAIPYATLAAAVQMEARSGTFGDYLSLLRTMELITTEGGHARANAEVLFL